VSKVSTLTQRVCRLFLLGACAFLAGNAATAEDRALVLDGKGQALLAVDLRTGAVTQRASIAGTPLLVLRSGDGARLAVLDPGPYKQTWCCRLQPKGPMIATLLDGATLAQTASVELGWGAPSLGAFGSPALRAFSMPSPDGRRVTVLVAGYHSKKPEETLPRELVTLDIVSGQIEGRIALDRSVDAMWGAAEGKTVVLFAAAVKSKEAALPAELLFVDLAQRAVTQRIQLNGAPTQSLMAPSGRWLYLLDPGRPSNKKEKNVNGEVTVVSIAERQVAARLDAGSKPRALVADEDRELVLVPSDGPPVDKGQTRVGELRAFSGAQQTAVITVAEEPHLLRINGMRAYLFGKRAVSVVELDGLRSLPEFALDDADNANELVFSKDGKRGFVQYQGSSRLSILDLDAPRLVGSVTTGRGGVKFAKALGSIALSAAATTASYYQGRSVAMTQHQRWFTYNIYNFGVAAPQSSVVVRPDGKFAYALNTQTNDVTVVDVATASVVSKEAAKGRALALLPGGSKIAVLGKDEMRLFDTETQLPSEPLRFEDATGVSLVFTKDGRTAVAYGGQGLYLLDAATGAVRAQVPAVMDVDSVMFEGSETPKK
jgi:DNA-binding beta-propeller fold protein YncE